MTLVVKNLPANGETWVWSLGWEDLLGKKMAIYSSILAWRIPWREEPRGLQSTGLQSQTWKSTHTHTHQAKNKETCINFHILNWSERLDFLGESKEKEIVAYKWIIMILSIDKKKDSHNINASDAIITCQYQLFNL